MGQVQTVIKQEAKQMGMMGILGQKKFLLLWLTYLASSLSVSFFLFVTNWYVVDYLRLEAMLGLVFFASTVPRVLFMLIGGAIADRVSKPWIMFVSDFAKGLILLGVIVLLFTDLLSIWVLIGLGLVFGILDAFFWPASGSILPTIVKEEELVRANSILDMTRQFSFICGPLIASFLLGIGGYTTVFAITAVFLLYAAFIDLKLRANGSEELKEESEKEGRMAKQQLASIMASIKEGFMYVKKSTFLTALMSTSVFLNLFFTGPYTLGMPIFTRNILGGDVLTYSLLTGSVTTGMLVGTFLIGMLNLKKKRGLISILSILAMSILFIVLSLTKVFWISIPVVILMGATIAFANVPLSAVIQSHTDKEYLGRVMSLLAFAAMGLTPISHLLTSSLLALGISIEKIMLVSSSCLCLFIVFTIIRAKPLREVD
ncbi:MFS transporter [Bacillus salitolerans]|uniref:MFS transporter n=1 Tax=Bacillus salitolerans TaxID=1437434 RepID=A0ABW4LX01_9BACI